jgi:hypothetical protein
MTTLPHNSLSLSLFVCVRVRVRVRVVCVCYVYAICDWRVMPDMQSLRHEAGVRRILVFEITGSAAAWFGRSITKLQPSMHPSSGLLATAGVRPELPRHSASVRRRHTDRGPCRRHIHRGDTAVASMALST